MRGPLSRARWPRCWQHNPKFPNKGCTFLLITNSAASCWPVTETASLTCEAFTRFLGSESVVHVRGNEEVPVKHCYLRFDVLLSAHILNGPWPLHDKKKCCFLQWANTEKDLFFTQWNKQKPQPSEIYLVDCNRSPWRHSNAPWWMDHYWRFDKIDRSGDKYGHKPAKRCHTHLALHLSVNHMNLCCRGRHYKIISIPLDLQIQESLYNNIIKISHIWPVVHL